MYDLELIDRLKKKDETSLIDLIDLYGDLIYRASYKILNNKELSEECLNLVMMKIWEGIEFYNKDEGLFKNWIYTLSKYTAIDIMRKESKYIKNILELKENIKDKSTVEDTVLIKEVIFEIKENIEKLSELDKEIFTQRYENDRKVKDIAHNLGITPKAISLRIMRIKNKLRRKD